MIRLLGDRVLIQRADVGEVRRGGIIIPDTAKGKPQEGTIVAVGDGRRSPEGTRVPLRVRVGDRVLFGTYAGSEVTLGDAPYVLLREDDLLGVFGE